MSRTDLLELLDGTLVDTSALVDQVTGGGGLAGIDVSDDDDVDMSLLLTARQFVSGLITARKFLGVAYPMMAVLDDSREVVVVYVV